MCRFLFFIVLLSSFVFQIGCSGSSADSTNSATDINAVPFAEITDANEALAVGNKLLDDNETEKAIDAFLRAVELNPNLAEAYFKLGIAYSLLETEEDNAELEDANAEPAEETNDQKAAKSNSEIAFKKAVDAYKSLIEQNPDDHLSHYNLGRAYNKLNRDEEAARSLRQAVKLNPEDTEYQTELGAILIKLADYREAIPPLKKALEIDPSNSRAEGLLEDAEAGRKRVDFTPPKKDDKAANSNANTDANSNSETGETGDKTKPGTEKKPQPPANKPSSPVRKPNQ
jgi:tetratricopeptide (TPR) repeat protein